MRAAIWASAFHWAAAAALLMVYAHISFGVALAVGAVGVISNLAIDRYLWRRNHPRVAPFLDPMTGELPGGRLPLPWQTRYALPAWALVVIATVTYLATT
jgi:hypothetical protein